MKRIEEIAESLGLTQNDYERYGKYKAKLELHLCVPSEEPRGKYVGVTAINPTPLGEGKTVTAVGLSMALNQLGHKTIATLREPSLGPVFGIKGGGAGGGKSTLQPLDEINLHFTGDMHAICAANNLLAAMVDNHSRRRLEPELPAHLISWRRAIDINDKGLSHIVTGLDKLPQAPVRETGFDLTAASEIMAILALTSDLKDLRERLRRIVVGTSTDKSLVTAEQIGCAGALVALLKDAIRPNLVQTCENTPAIVHTGPFANIAHGNSSIVADHAALQLADYVVTESGFGADCGAEKFFNIKCRTNGLKPDVEVLVCTVRAVKFHRGRFAIVPGKPLPQELVEENLEDIEAGAINLKAHIEIVKKFGVPVVVAINRFPTDTDKEVEAIGKIALEFGADGVAVSNVFAEGGAGGIDLAEAVVRAAELPSQFRLLYSDDLPLKEKLRTIAKEIYGADDVDFEQPAERKLKKYEDFGHGHLPICVSKTQYSLSHDPKLLGRPAGFRFPIRDVRLSAGAGFVYALAGEIRTMPGLPKTPAAKKIDIDDEGNIVGLE